MLTLEVNEKDQAPLGQRIRPVGMCFYKKGDLAKGNNYQLHRNSDNPKDTNCFEVRSLHITMVKESRMYKIVSSRMYKIVISKLKIFK